MDVTVEGGGKDHSTKGGSRDIANAISREVFKREPPLNVPYEFFVVGGKKMSSSKGAGSSSREVADLLPPHMLRFLLTYKEPLKVIDFQPDGDTIPVLFDTFDKYADGFFAGTQDDYSKTFTLSYAPAERAALVNSYRPRFSQVAFMAQMPHIDPRKEVATLAEHALTPADEATLDERLTYARKWLNQYAPENYVYKIQDTLPESARSFSPVQKRALGLLKDYVASQSQLDGQALHAKLHDLKTETPIEPKELFEAIYLSILGKKSGPKAGWFLSVLDKAFLEKRLSEVVG
jgi:lysyl-tRNA synthetase class 1